MNRTRILLGGLAAGVVINVSEFILNMYVVPVEGDQAGSMAFWVFYAFVLGILVAYMYAFVRPRCGGGPKAGICAGTMVWLLHTALPQAGLMNMGLQELTLIGLVWPLAELILCGLVAGRLYSEGDTAA